MKLAGFLHTNPGPENDPGVDAAISEDRQPRRQDLSSVFHTNLRATRVGRMMATLLAVEWIALVLTTLFYAPKIWAAAQSGIFPHLLAAVLAGPLLILPVVWLAVAYPARRFTPHAVAIAQMLVSSLLIDITGGRIESHFHIFVSLAFLAFYRDWRVLLTASVITTADQVLRGAFLPQTIYGVMAVSPWRWVEQTAWVIFEDVVLIVGGWRENRFDWGAHHDALTGLANRRLLTECYHAISQDTSHRRAVLFIDLDRFKQVNDALGHATGDQLLKTVAVRLSKALEEKMSGDRQLANRTTLARLGGDEFVVVIENIGGPEEAIEAADKMLAAVRRPFNVEDNELTLSASIGIALSPDHGTELETLQERADKGMYFAKKQGRSGCVVYSPEIETHNAGLQDIGRDLRHALVRRELSLHYQPLLSRDAAVTGFEALLRWNHPVHGAVAPMVFIPMAEHSGLISDLGLWVLGEACRECRTWQRPDRDPIGVSVNVSPVQLEQPDFPLRVMTILRDCELDPALLTLELTEGAAIRSISHTSQQLAGLRALGVKVALDDFGTGYSSLSYLASLSADTIKLDRSFLHRDCVGDSAIVQAVVSMAHRIGMSVVAEGVETLDQCERLKNLNCDELQGYYFSRPVPADAVRGVLESFGGSTSDALVSSSAELLALAQLQPEQALQ